MPDRTCPPRLWWARELPKPAGKWETARQCPIQWRLPTTDSDTRRCCTTVARSQLHWTPTETVKTTINHYIRVFNFLIDHHCIRFGFYQNQRRSSVLPAKLEVLRWLARRHLLDVAGQSLNPVEHGYGNYLEERQEEYGHRGCVMIDQLEDVNSTLKKSLIT